MKKLEIIQAAGIIIFLQSFSFAQILHPETESHSKRLLDKIGNSRDLTQWIGLSDDWDDPLNWDNGVPDVTTDVIIPNGCHDYPYLTGTLGVDTVDANIPYTCANLLITSEAELIIRSGSADLMCKGVITCNGYISVGDDMYLFDGAEVNLNHQNSYIKLGYYSGYIGSMRMYEGSTVNQSNGTFSVEWIFLYNGCQYNGSGGYTALSSNDSSPMQGITIDDPDSYFNYFEISNCDANTDTCEADLNVYFLYVNEATLYIMDDTISCDLVVVNDDYSGHIVMDDGQFNISNDFMLNDYTEFYLNGGEVNIGGTFSIGGDGGLIMNGGTLNCLGSMSGYYDAYVTMSEGLMNLHKNLILEYTNFQASGGIVSFKGSANSNIYSSPTFYNLLIEKDPGIKVILNENNSINVLNNLIINGGTLDPMDRSLYVGGSWTNNAGDSGFDEGTSLVTFFRSSNTEITTNETFYDLKIDKNTTDWDLLEFNDGITINVLHQLSILDGVVQMNNNSTLNVGASLFIALGAGLNAGNGSGQNINIGRNWVNYNTTFDNAGIGFSPGTSTVTFNGTQDASIEFAGNTESFFNLVIDKTSDTLFCPDSLMISGDIHLVNGICYGSPTHATLLGDLTCENNGKWDNTRLLLTGTDDQSVSLSSICLFGQITIDKQSEAFGPQNIGSRSQAVNLHSDLHIFGDEDLVVESGTLHCDDIDLFVSGSVMINDGGTLDIAPGASLNVKEKISVNDGGILSAIGTGPDPITFTDWSGALLDGIIVRGGGSVSCSYSIFEFLNDSAVFIKNGALVDNNNPFSHCSFSDTEPGTTLITINNNQSLILEDIDFGTNPGGGAFNIGKTANQGQISLTGCTGAFAGPVYENDPHSRIDWTDVGSWTGVSNNDWLTASNWAYSILPDADQDVTISPGYINAPAILSKSHCKSLELQSGTDIYILDTLCIHGDLAVAGSVIIDSGPENVVETDGDITWQDGAQCTAGANSKIDLQGDWVFETGSDVHLDNGTVCFTSSASQRIKTHESNSFFNNILSQSPDTLFFSYLCTDTLSCKNLLIGSGSTVVINSSQPVEIGNSVNNNLGQLYANYGELIFNGSQGAIVVQPGDHLNNLKIMTDNYVELNADHTDTLVINGDFVIGQSSSKGRAFDPNGHVVIVYGNWANDEGSTGFIETGSSVIFKGTEPSALLTSETFDNLKLDKTGVPENGLLAGPANDQGVNLTVLGDLVLLDGTLELNDPCELTIGGNIQIAMGAGLNADDTDFTINVGGNWINENTASSPTEGFYHQGQGLVMFNGTVSTFQNVYQLTEFHNIDIYRPEGYHVRPLGAPILAHDIVVISGILRTAGNKVVAANDIVIQDKLEMESGSGDSLIAYGDIYWQTGSEALAEYGEIKVHGDWTFTNGCDVQISKNCKVRMVGTEVSRFFCMDNNSSIGTLILDKDTAMVPQTNIAVSSTDTLRVSGDLTLRKRNEFRVFGKQLHVKGYCLSDTLSLISMSAATGNIEIDSILILSGHLNVNTGTVNAHGLCAFEQPSQLDINGGSFICDVSDFPAVTNLSMYGGFTLSSGLFAVTGKGLHLMSGSSNDISGGTILSKGPFFARSGSVFQPTGGKVEMIGNDDCTVRLAEGLWFNNLVINKNTGYSVSAISDININGDLSIEKGTFNTNGKTLRVGD